MSISYYAISVRDHAQLGPLLEGGPTTAPPIDVAATYAALVRGAMVEGPPNATLQWEGEGSYVFVDLSPRAIEVTHGTGGGEEQMDVVMDVLSVLQGQGLYVWDPQSGSWFPGS
ncbi:MAG: hypothetical protein KF729_06195 [Sandaracinaceae bacterium]|nr:hypothetical protein [Sandaracinaceae bacterium]